MKTTKIEFSGALQEARHYLATIVTKGDFLWSVVVGCIWGHEYGCLTLLFFLYWNLIAYDAEPKEQKPREIIYKPSSKHVCDNCVNNRPIPWEQRYLLEVERSRKERALHLSNIPSNQREQ